ncbi:hypothetical protein [Xanthomonas sp. GPE 39]|uniref:hypothetical protein n=1 Tax=Xanthomonas sp. GPE 39 TaxID=1583099 RepID=UPI001F2CDAF1|nr:hypothetical protein [Xanthomonas sp. GPE 39]
MGVVHFLCMRAMIRACVADGMVADHVAAISMCADLLESFSTPNELIAMSDVAHLWDEVMQHAFATATATAQHRDPFAVLCVHCLATRTSRRALRRSIGRGTACIWAHASGGVHGHFVVGV